MALSFREAPSLEEFEEAIRTTKKKSAGGMSGTTYAMFRVWPTEVVKQVYEILVRMFLSKTVPVKWKWKWLVPIVKGENDGEDVNNLRPIALVEALRKVWIGIIVRKVQTIWAKYELLSSSQHAYLHGLGTDSASLQLIHVLEVAREMEADLYLSSWDFKGRLIRLRSRY